MFAKKSIFFTHGLLLLAAAGISLMYIFIANLHGILSPLQVGLARFLIASLVFVPFLSLHSFRAIARRDWLPLIIISIGNGAAATLLIIVASGMSPSSNVSAIINANPLFIFAFAPWLIKEAANRLMWLGVCLGFFGLYLIIFQSFAAPNLLAAHYLPGNLLALLATMLIAITTLYQKKYLTIYPPQVISALVFICSAILLLILAIFNHSVSLTNWSFYSIFNLLGLGIISTALPFFIFNYGIARLGANQASAYKMTIPLFAALFAVLFLGEHLSFYTVAGLLISTIGIILVNKKTAFNS